jgi:hypothetical protein
MNVKLSYDMDFSAIIIDDTRMVPTTFNVSINVITATENGAHQNIAFQRILFFINEILRNSVIINAKNPIILDVFKMFPRNHFCVIPDDPYEQLIGFILFHKLSAITEEKLEIDRIIISSNTSNDIMYTIDDFNDFESEDTDKIDWWNRSDITCSEDDKLTAAIAWDDIDLNWDYNPEDDEVEFQQEPTFSQLKKNPSIVVLDGGKKPAKE